MVPSAAKALFTTLRTAGRSVMSRVTSHRRSLYLALRSFIASNLRTVPATRSPRSSSASVMRRPKPLLTPVMSQVLCVIAFFLSIIPILLGSKSNRRDRPAIDHDFRSRDRRSPVRGSKGDQFCNFIRPVRPAKRDPAQHVHEFLSGRCVIALVLVRHSLNHARGGVGLYESR